MKDNPFLLCQPDDRKGCCACCGLFNVADLSREHLEKFLGEGSFRRDNGWRYTEEDCYVERTLAVRDDTTHICAFQGFLSPGKPGCLVHPLSCGEEGRDASLFGSKVCGNFLCPAYKIFSEEEKGVLIENIDDWYLYTFALADPLSMQWILKQLEKAPVEKNSEAYGSLLNGCVTLLARHLAAYRAPVFCYSLPEYNTGSVFFSITSDKAEGAGEARKAVHTLIAEASDG